MKIILLAVMSLNGKITKGDESNIYNWTSKEDQNLFFDLLQKNNLIVMGSRTYESVKSIIKPNKNTLRIILTKRLNKFNGQTIKDQIEFSDESPVELAKRLEKKGYKQMLLVGGGAVNASFLKSNLVDEIYLTLEPVIFGQGKPLFGIGQYELKLKLITIKKLNNQGALLLKYTLATYAVANGPLPSSNPHS